METIQYLLSKLLWVIVIVAILIVGFILMRKFAPELMSKFSLGGGTGSFFTDYWLPEPVNLVEVTKPIKADLTGNVYEGSMSPGTSYVIYGENGMEIVKVPPKSPTFNAENSGFADSSIYIRNLSIHKEESIRTGKVFYGEARSTFFSNGKFPVYIVDSTGRIFAKEEAVQTGQWSIPGWSRFSVQVKSFLPAHQSCQVLFAPDPSSPDGRTNARAVTPVVCN